MLKISVNWNKESQFIRDFQTMSYDSLTRQELLKIYSLNKKIPESDRNNNR